MKPDFIDDDLDNFLVTYINREDGDFLQYFECYAMDSDHAREQCKNAEPNAIIVEIEWHPEG